MTTYAQKLKDPRWQKKRLQVFERAGFECEFCGDKDSTLHAHHRAYVKGREPWDYDEFEIACLCENCHRATHADREVLTESLNKARLDVNVCFSDTLLAGFIDAYTHDGPFDMIMYDGEYIDGVAHYFKVPSSLIHGLMESGGILRSDDIARLKKELVI